MQFERTMLRERRLDFYPCSYACRMTIFKDWKVPIGMLLD
jgi:hypothetical protein